MDKLNGKVILKQSVHGKISLPYSTNRYEGEYEVSPSIDGETLPTANKMMIDDVTINPIPYSEVDNVGGGITVNIAFTL